jgi:hypothetical protein
MKDNLKHQQPQKAGAQASLSPTFKLRLQAPVLETFNVVHEQSTYSLKHSLLYSKRFIINSKQQYQREERQCPTP